MGSVCVAMPGMVDRDMVGRRGMAGEASNDASDS